jgi:hypothetical protein
VKPSYHSKKGLSVSSLLYLSSQYSLSLYTGFLQKGEDEQWGKKRKREALTKQQRLNHSLLFVKRVHQHLPLCHSPSRLLTQFIDPEFDSRKNGPTPLRNPFFGVFRPIIYVLDRKKSLLVI